MSQMASDLLRDLEEFRDSPAGIGQELRLSVAEIVLRRLREKRWSQRRLADETGLKESYVSRILHSNVNCKLDTVGKFFHALGIRARVRDSSQPVFRIASFDPVASELGIRLLTMGYTHGKKVFHETKTTEGEAAGQEAICL